MDDINPNDIDCLILPGGRSAEFLRLDERVKKIVSTMF
jgi:putative intracellular protease/amidase